MGELILVIRGQDNHQDFNQEDFIQFCQRAYGGNISLVTQSEQDWTFRWLGNEHELQDVVAKAEDRRIDSVIQEHNGLYLLELQGNEECLYSYVPELEIETQTPSSVDSAVLQPLASEVDVLLVTATPIELDAVIAEMEPWPERQEIIQGSLGNTTYRFGRFGRYRTAHVQCTIGGGRRAGAMATTLTAIQQLQPKAVLILGIAFGIDRQNQRLGDVIVAESVYPYELERVGVQRSIRDQPMNCGRTLSDRFRNNFPNWSLRCGSRSVRVHQGPIVSGGKLIDNQQFRDQLIENCCPTARGGEMEGAGAYAAAQNQNTEIILVKGICDWADGHKNDRAQSFAAHAAVSLAKYVLNQPDVLTELGAVDLESPTPLDLRSHPEDSKPSPLVKFTQLVFQPTKVKIILANKYKSLHDEFQSLESWEDPVYRFYVIGSLPQNDPAWLNDLPRYSLKLQNHVKKIVGELDGEEVKKEIGTRRIVWRETLREAENKFEQAIDQKEQKKLKNSVELIEAVIRPGLSFMNDSLKNTVKDFKLHQSVEALKTFKNTKIFERLNPEQSHRFKNSLQNLENMEERLEVLLKIHNDFQGLDNELDNIERQLRSTVVDVTPVSPLHWRILGQMLQEMCREKEYEWAKQLCQQRKELESAVTEKDASKITKSFVPLRSYVNIYFNDIDKKLKEVCETLTFSVVELDTVLSGIPNIS